MTEIPRQPSPEVPVSINGEEVTMTHHDAEINMYQTQYEHMNHVKHIRKMGRGGIILFNCQELIDKLQSEEFPQHLYKYPTQTVVDLYEMYENKTLNADLEKLFEQ
jgi:hypothetical protein